MATNVNAVNAVTNSIYFTNIEGLKSTLDEIDGANIRTAFKTAKDPIYLAFDHLNKQPLKKLAKGFVKDISDSVVEFITSIPGMFQGE